MKGLEKHIQELGLFFYLVSNNEFQAEHCTQKTIDKLRDSQFLDVESDDDRDALMFQMALQILGKNHKQLERSADWAGKTTPFLSSHSNELGPWKQFQKRSRREDLITIVLSGAIGVKPKVAAKILGVTEGTLKYRMARGLRHLSRLLVKERSIDGTA